MPVWKKLVKKTKTKQKLCIRSMRTCHKTASAKSRKQTKLSEMDYRIRSCRKEIFFEKEQEELKMRIQSYTSTHLERKTRINEAQIIIKDLMMKWEHEVQKLEKG